VAVLARDSKTQVSDPFFELLGGARGKSPLDLETQVNQYRVVAEEQAKRARGLSVPDDAKPAHRNLVLSLNLRAEGLGKIADKVRTALGDEGSQEAVDEIAGQMQMFLASDVLFSQRVVPLILQALEESGVRGEPTQESRFLPNLQWLTASTVGNRLGKRGTGATDAVAPGLHGHGLESVTVAGGAALQPSPAANRVKASASPAFDVKFANQGTNDEVDVEVRIRITGAGRTISGSKTIDQTKAGTSATATISLPRAPPIGEAVTITVEVLAVPGERKTDNNRQRYTAFFTR
jgi:hypothetical protein